MLQRAFRARITVEDMIADGDKVVVRLANYLVHEGTFLGIPATGKSATIQGIAIHRIRGGKIAERWILIDTAALLQQLGAIPQPNATTA
jgi:predicted ester cyclase